MTDLDQKIEEALALEDKALQAQFGEQGILTQWFSTYQGKQGWIAIVITLVMFVLFGVAVYSGYKFFNVTNTVDGLRWGAAVWCLLTMISFMKVWFWMRMESNRVIREVKRVELQLVRLQAKMAA